MINFFHDIYLRVRYREVIRRWQELNSVQGNQGVLVKPPEPTDYIAGAVSGIGYEEVLPSGNWDTYLPHDELQHYNWGDTMGCVSFSALNAVETQLNRYLLEGLIPNEVLQEMQGLGYLNNNKFNLSDRFLAKMSGTTKNGNYLAKVADTLRNVGAVPEKDWRWVDTTNWDTYYAEIPQSIQDKAKKLLDFVEIKYEWISLGSDNLDNIERHLQHAPLQVALKTCSPWRRALVKWCGGTDVNHAVVVYNIDEYRNIFDHYSPCKRKLTKNYLMPWVLKILVVPKWDTQKNDMLKLVIKDGEQYVAGKDGKHYHIYNLHVLKVLQDAGVVARMNPEQVDTINDSGEAWVSLVKE